MKYLRIALVVLAIVLITVPVAIVSMTGNGWDEMSAKILISLSISSLIGTTLLGLDRNNKNKFYVKIGVSVGLLLVLLSQWL